VTRRGEERRDGGLACSVVFGTRRPDYRVLVRVIIVNKLFSITRAYLSRGSLVISSPHKIVDRLGFQHEPMRNFS
jgi:hypothetical protein